MTAAIRKATLLLLLGGPLAWGQGAAPAQALPAPGPATPRLPADALRVPLFRQATGYSCGACSLQAVLCYWQVFSGQESQLYGKLGTTPKDGTHPDKFVEVARSFGLAAHPKEGTTLADLRTALAQGTTVILNLQAWREPGNPVKPWKDTWEEGHYIVLVGLDDHFLYAMDPSVAGAFAYMPLKEFQERWHDYEDRTGTRRDYRQLAIFIQGKRPMGSFPGPLVRLE